MTYYTLPYLILMPDYMCRSKASLTSNDPIESFECKPDDFCPADSLVNIDYINWNSDRSLYNWVQKLDLSCKTDTEIGLIGAMYFVGILCSVLTFMRLSDIYGRKWPIIACQFIQLPAYVWMFYMNTLYEAYAIFFLFGLGFSGTISISILLC